MICDTCQNQVDLENDNIFDSNFYCKYRKEEFIYYNGNCEGYKERGCGMTKQYGKFGVDTKAKRLYTETSVDDIIGLVKTDEPTDSVQLKKEAQLSICEKRLIELEKENDQLKKELDQFYLLIGRGDWSGLVDLIKGDLE